MAEILINSDFITLTQFLKIIGAISTGGEAKFYLLDNDIYVDEIIEKRRGKKLFNGTIIKVFDKKYIIKGVK